MHDCDARDSGGRKRTGGQPPGVLGGTPVFHGTRLPVATLFDYLADGLSLDYFLETFPTVTREQVTAVLRYGQERLNEELGG